MTKKRLLSEEYEATPSLNLSDKIRVAMDFASFYHKGQYRKSTKLPYFTHPFNVYLLAKKYGLGKNEKILSLLHDTVEDANKEDVDTIKKEITYFFGNQMLKLVLLLTKEISDYKKYLDMVAKYPDVLNVKLLDMMHNLSDSPSQKQIDKYTDAIKYLLEKNIKNDILNMLARKLKIK